MLPTTIHLPQYVSQQKGTPQKMSVFKRLTNILAFSIGVPPMGGGGGNEIH